MKKLLSLALLALFCLHPLYAQETSQATADSLRLAGDLDRAIDAYHDVLSHHPNDGEILYTIASTYALQPHRLDSAFHYLRRALEQDATMKPLWDADLYFMRDDARWATIEETQLAKLAAQVTGDFNKAYARQLFEMRMREHAFRYHLMLTMRTLGQASPVVTALGKAMQEHHDDNLIRLEELIRDYGWPAISQVGEEAAYAAGNVVNHADLATRQQYLPVLKAACEQGEADWSRYAHILDRVELEVGNEQIYGTQMEFKEADKRFVPQPMIDPDNVNQRRAEIGMEPIEAQLSRFNKNVMRDFGLSK